MYFLYFNIVLYGIYDGINHYMCRFYVQRHFTDYLYRL